MARYFKYEEGIEDNIVKAITFHRFGNELTTIAKGVVKIEADDAAIAEWLSVQNCNPVELGETESAELIKAIEKTEGALYGSYKVPFMNEDAIGMLQVKAAFEMGVTNTNIEFSNGTIMPMSVSDFPAFAAWFAQKRNGYFV